MTVHDAECKRCGLILAFLGEFSARNGYAPNYREMAAAVGLSAHSAIQVHLGALEARGAIRRKVGGNRSIAVVAP